MKNVFITLVAIATSFQVQAQQVLFDNGPFITNPGMGFNGADASVLQNITLGSATFGYTVGSLYPYRLTDQFTNAEPWYIEYIDVYAYQTGSTTTSTFTGAFLTIWNNDPSMGIAIPQFGDFTTNRMTLTNFTNCYRVLENDVWTANNRPIMRIRIQVDAVISAGTHWPEWTFSASLASGPFAPPITIPGQGITGDGKQFNGSNYVNIFNGPHNVGIPFTLHGNTFTVTVPTCQEEVLTLAYNDPIPRNVGNTYSVELSDANGIFPGTLLSTTDIGGNQLTAIMPGSVTASNNYRVRVIASDPSDASAPSNSFQIGGGPSVIPASNELNAGQFTVFSTNAAGSFRWENQSNFQVGTGNSFTTPVLITPTTYYIIDETPLVCRVKTDVPVTIAASPTFSGRRKY